MSPSLGETLAGRFPSSFAWIWKKLGWSIECKRKQT